MVNILSIDVEDYFQVEGFDGIVPKSDWDRYEIRFHLGLEWLLQILDSARVKATFFVLGWIAEHHPHWVQEIHRKGHEISLHGFDHRRVHSMNRDEFGLDVKQNIGSLEALGISGIRGYRAPSFSITPQTPWAWDVLKESGLAYDASLSSRYFPTGRIPWRSDDPGPTAHQTASGETLRLFPQAYLPFIKRVPFAGGGYFRLYPYWLTHWGIKTWNRRGVPVMVYVHPWEFDPSQPRMKAKFTARMKHYVNLEASREKFSRLLQDFKFAPCRDFL